MPLNPVIWHDIENGPYSEDLALWHKLALSHGAPILDIGCGTGRVAIDLARAGHEVIAFDNDPVLVDALIKRAGELPISAFVADAREFEVDRPVPLVIVPMQTVQLLGGEHGRARMLRCAHTALQPGGALAFAIADARTATTSPDDLLPAPDMREVDGTVYASRPVAIVDEGHQVSIHRSREIVNSDGTYSESSDRIALDVLDADTLEAEAAAVGFKILPREAVAETGEYISSTVVMLRA
jgi:SAM-dependent methyltransferase